MPQPTDLHPDEQLYAMALSRLVGFNFAACLQLYKQLGSARAVYEHRHHLREQVPDCTERFAAQLSDWQEALDRSRRELDFMQQHGIRALVFGQNGYPQRLCECGDAPLVLYFLGHGELNPHRVINIVGTRRATPYSHDLIRTFVRDLRQLCPGVLIVSGLAYGVDICAHREALANGLPTVGVLAHGLDELYPPRHRDTAKEMLQQGGLLTEHMTCSVADKRNFVKRNRIVAGMTDATVLVESAAKGGGLITCSMAQDYQRTVCAFPGPVGAPYSEGCNQLIRHNGAVLITSAADFIDTMGWQTDAAREQAKASGIERQLFPTLSPDEERIVAALTEGDQPLNQLAVRCQLAVGQLTALLFRLEMEGVVRPLAGGTYHLLK